MSDHSGTTTASRGTTKAFSQVLRISAVEKWRASFPETCVCLGGMLRPWLTGTFLGTHR